MTDKIEWLSNWASNVQYASTDELYKKILNELVVPNIFEGCDISYGITEDSASVVLKVTGQTNTSVILSKK